MDPPVSMGTSIIAVTYNGGVILGADSRTSTGSYIANRVADKITPLADKVYILRSGSAADTQAIASYVQLYISQHQAEANEEIPVKTAARLAMNMAYNNKDMLQAGLIIAGWDKYGGGTVWGIPLGGTIIQTPFATGGSGSSYIYGFCDKYWKAGMTETEAKDFVVRALSFAMARDASSGGCIRTVTIDASGVRRDFLPGSQVPVTYGEMPNGQTVVA
eukprot:CAMPEP_0202901310 /NCGR_PEP_ID=MMETSP1392-20130828/14183_1 /ASSEMBLY_ACC=CAM_ASM_000868 /TAXON_ID=225041 /ORGANISM="Chlamydomonas chlamydogama, Strain SAG 11-48b" /LENGTH=217 /DNA_ID=CAMNT_0049587857 /DNA_START=140 /DNA_END=793 /DNA_ORIENTATION=+